MKNTSHICPVCRKTLFSHRHSFEFCYICGWTDDNYQECYPDEECCANIMSLNEAKKALIEGITVDNYNHNLDGMALNEFIENLVPFAQIRVLQCGKTIYEGRVDDIVLQSNFLIIKESCVLIDDVIQINVQNYDASIN